MTIGPVQDEASHGLVDTAPPARPARESCSGLLKIAMVGTRGVPAAYGGFETAVEEVGRRLVERGHRVTVYSRRAEQRVREHLGMRVVHLPALH